MSEKTEPNEVDTDNSSTSDSDDKWSLKSTAKTGVDAGVTFATGMANAFSDGVRSFGDSINEDNVLKADWDNGIVKGSVEGSCSALDGISRAFRDTYHSLADSEEDSDSASG